MQERHIPTLVPSCRDFHAGCDLITAIEDSRSGNWPISLSRRHGRRADDVVSGFQQGSSRLSQTAAGGHDVVDHDHRRTRCHAGDAESALEIGGSLSSAEPCLIAHRTRLMQQPAGSNRRLWSEQPSGSPRQSPGRIEAPLPHGGTRGRHRNQHYGAPWAEREVKNAPDCGRQPARKEWRQVQCSPLFVCSDELPQDRIVRCCADREGKAGGARVRTWSQSSHNSEQRRGTEGRSPTRALSSRGRPHPAATHRPPKALSRTSSAEFPAAELQRHLE